MLNLKKTAVAVLAFGSSAVFAGTMGPVCTPGNVTVPCEKQAWDLGAKALYLQATYGGQLGTVGVAPAAVTANNSEEFINEDSAWSWGFYLEGSYHFSTGNDVNVNWYYWNSDTTTRTFTGDFDFLTAGGNASDTFRMDSTWNQVDVEFGQHVDMGEFSNLRLHGGFQWSAIKANRTETGSTAASVLQETNSFESKYNGFGPRVGVDYDYDWGNGLGVYAKGAVSVLIGDAKFNFSHTPGSAVAATHPSSVVSDNKGQVVPELEGKLGATYTFAMAQGDVSLDVGYMWNTYVNALPFANVQAGATAGAVGPQNVPTEYSFGVQGLYFGAKWVGNVV